MRNIRSILLQYRNKVKIYQVMTSLNEDCPPTLMSFRMRRIRAGARTEPWGIQKGLLLWEDSVLFIDICCEHVVELCIHLLVFTLMP